MITVDEVKLHLTITIDDVEEDNLIQRLIDAETDRASCFCSTQFRKQTVKMLARGNNSSSIQCSLPVRQILKSTIDGVDIDTSEFFYNNYNIHYIDHYFNKPLNKASFNVVFELETGYDETDAPTDLKLAILESVCLRYRERDRVGHSSKSISGETVSFITTEMTNSSVGKLSQFKRVSPEYFTTYIPINV